MKITINLTGCISIVLPWMLLLPACKPIREIKQPPLPYYGDNHFTWLAPVYTASEKNVFIIADKNGTEIFDMLTPFYLFNATGKANVYIIARDKRPVVVKKNLFVLPQMTLAEADSMKLQADVIVVPALAARTAQQDIVLIDWIKAHVTPTTKILAICDGASTAAATGLYDGKPMTCHASDYTGIKIHFPNVNWVQNINVTKSGNLYSTAGVSNAVEGALTVINDLFDRETMIAVASAIQYPHAEIKTVHKSIAMNGNTKLHIAKKVMFTKNRNTGLLIQNGMNEFFLAGIIDIYSRSFPSSFTSFCMGDSTIQTKYGLTILSQSIPDYKQFDEVHITMPLSQADKATTFGGHTKIVQYNGTQNFMIDACLERIKGMYGANFSNVVKILLDYN
jgi:putative intracellular protease/amidase